MFCEGGWWVNILENLFGVYALVSYIHTYIHAYIPCLLHVLTCYMDTCRHGMHACMACMHAMHAHGMHAWHACMHPQFVCMASMHTHTHTCAAHVHFVCMACMHLSCSFVGPESEHCASVFQFECVNSAV